eukprot:336572_1
MVGINQRAVINMINPQVVIKGMTKNQNLVLGKGYEGDKSKSTDKYDKSKSGSGKYDRGYEWDKSTSTDKRDNGYGYGANKGYNKYDNKRRDEYGYGKKGDSYDSRNGRGNWDKSGNEREYAGNKGNYRNQKWDNNRYNDRYDNYRDSGYGYGEWNKYNSYDGRRNYDDKDRY